MLNIVKLTRCKMHSCQHAAFGSTLHFADSILTSDPINHHEQHRTAENRKILGLFINRLFVVSLNIAICPCKNVTDSWDT